MHLPKNPSTHPSIHSSSNHLIHSLIHPSIQSWSMSPPSTFSGSTEKELIASASRKKRLATLWWCISNTDIHAMDGRAEFREVTQPCRTDKKPVLDINPKTSLSEPTLFWFRRDRAKYSHHHLRAFGCIFYFLFFFLTEPPPSLCQRSHLSLSASAALGPAAPSPARSPAAPCPPPPSSPWVSDRRADGLAPAPLSQRGTSSGARLRQVVYLSQGYWQRSYRWNSICLGTDVCLRGRRPISPLSLAFQKPLLPPPPQRRPPASGAPPPALPKTRCNPVGRRRERSAERCPRPGPEAGRRPGTLRVRRGDRGNPWRWAGRQFGKDGQERGTLWTAGLIHACLFTRRFV